MRVKGGLSAKVTALALKANTVASALKSVVIAQALKAEVLVGFFLRIILFADTARTSDNDTLDVSKNLSESPSLIDDDTIAFGKNPSETPTVTEDSVFDVQKFLEETPTVSQLRQFLLSRGFSNASTVAEDATLLLNKIFSEAPSLSDDDTLAITKLFSDATALTDDDVLSFNKQPSEAVSTTDDEVFAVQKFFTENPRVTDDLDGEASAEDDQEIQFVKTRTDSASVTQVFSRIVAYVRAFSENPLVAEAHRFDASKALTEAPAASDSDTVQFTKVAGDRTDQDYCTLSYFAENYLEGPPIDIVAFDDTQALSFGSSASDSGSVSQTFARTVAYARAFTESASVAQTLTKAVVSALSDNGSFSDSDVKSVGLSRSDAGVAADSGSLRSQGYCDFTYFAEDYVGASRTFT